MHGKGLSALADKTRIVSTKSKDKFLCCLRCPHSTFQSGQVLSTPKYSTDYIFHLFNHVARQNIEHFVGILDHVQILAVVPCFVLLNLAQIADETLLMVCLFLRHHFISKSSCPFNG